MKKCAILLSHKVNPEQEQELREKWGVGSIHFPPQDIQSRFSQIPPEGEYPMEHIQPVLDWLEETTSLGIWLGSRANQQHVFCWLSGAKRTGAWLF